jgi:hypothetical protein
MGVCFSQFPCDIATSIKDLSRTNSNTPCCEIQSRYLFTFQHHRNEARKHTKAMCKTAFNVVDVIRKQRRLNRIIS